MNDPERHRYDERFIDLGFEEVEEEDESRDEHLQIEDWED